MIIVRQNKKLERDPIALPFLVLLFGQNNLLSLSNALLLVSEGEPNILQRKEMKTSYIATRRDTSQIYPMQNVRC